MTDSAWLLLRIASFVLVLQAAGIAMFRLSPPAALLPASGAVLGALARRAAIAAVFAVVAASLIEPAHLGGEFPAVLDPGMERLSLASSGTELATRLAGVVCLALGARLGAASSRPLALVGIMLAVLSFVLTGHVAASPQRPLLTALLFFHVTVVAWWFGALLPFHRAARLEAPAQMASALAAFSHVAVRLVPTIALAGVAMAALLLPDLGALLQPYGLLLLTKTALFALLMGLAAVNRRALTARIADGSAAALAFLRGTLLAEYVLIIAVLAATAVMTGLYSPS